MLNTAVIAPQTTRPGPTSAPDPAAPATGASAPFAQALGQASAQQREDAQTRQTLQAPAPNGTGEAGRVAPVATAAARQGLARRGVRCEVVIGEGLPTQAQAAAPTTERRAVGQATSDKQPRDPARDELLELAALMSGLAPPPRAEATSSMTFVGETVATANDHVCSVAASDELLELAALMSGLAPPPWAEAVVSAAEVAQKLACGDQAGATCAQTTLLPGRWRSEAAASAEFASSTGPSAVPALVPNLDPGHAAARVVTTAVVAAVDPASDMSPRSAGEAAARELVSQDAPTFGADSRREGAAVVAPAATPMTAAPLPVMPRPMHSAMPFQGELSVALRSPEFAPALGTQLGIWVRDGIERAQLKLNPAEMGPIDVRISLDGDRARVDFSAAHAGTRQVLQDAVPVLASTLRESGLTLTGGGVFDQSHDPRGDAQPDTPQGGPRVFDAMEGGASSHTAAARLPRARGVVDLYA